MSRKIAGYSLAMVVTVGNVPGSTEDPWYSDLNMSGGSGSAGKKAWLALAALAAHHLDTVVESHVIGVLGDFRTIAVTGDSPGGGGVTTSVIAQDLVVHYESGVSTVLQVENAIDALAGLENIIDVKTPGTPGTVLTSPADDVPATALGLGMDASTAGLGHQTQGYHPDLAVLGVLFHEWGAADKVEIVLQRCSEPGSIGGQWATIDPSSLDGLTPGTLLAVDGPLQIEADGKMTLYKALAVGQRLAIPVRIDGAQRFRFGVRGHTGSPDGVELEASLELIQRNIYA